jgi:hypothetical protein
MDLGTNNKFCPMQHLKIGVYDRGGQCLLRGTHRPYITQRRVFKSFTNNG